MQSLEEDHIEDEEGKAETTMSSEMARLIPSSTVVPCRVIERRVFDVSSLSGSINQDVCPIRPNLDVCLLVCFA